MGTSLLEEASQFMTMILIIITMMAVDITMMAVDITTMEVAAVEVVAIITMEVAAVVAAAAEEAAAVAAVEAAEVAAAEAVADAVAVIDMISFAKENFPRLLQDRTIQLILYQLSSKTPSYISNNIFIRTI